MAINFRVTVIEFALDVAEATNQQIEDMIDIYGFLGDWKNPTHILVVLAGNFWAIPFCDLEEKLQNSTGEPQNEEENLSIAEDLFSSKFGVWFIYKGTDQAFLDAVIKWHNKKSGNVSC